MHVEVNFERVAALFSAACLAAIAVLLVILVTSLREAQIKLDAAEARAGHNTQAIAKLQRDLREVSKRVVGEEGP